MQPIQSRGKRSPASQDDAVHASNDSALDSRPRRTVRLTTFLVMVAVIAALAACSSGGGGDSGRPDSANPDPFGLNFSYPFDGQEDVPLDTQIVVTFPNAVQGDVDGALRLQMGRGTGQPTTPITVEQDSNQPNILRIKPEGNLKPNSDYRIVANRRISDGDTFVNKDIGLFSFSTRPFKGSPASDGFDVVQTTPGNTNSATGETAVFTQFNALRVRFSEPVDPATISQGDSFTFTGPDGPVEGKLTALGRNLTFDPIDDLEPGDYTLKITNAVTSKFGNTLAAYTETKTVISAGQTLTENLKVEPTAKDVSGLPDSALNGLPTNLASICLAACRR